MNETGKSDKPVVPAKPAKLDFWAFCQKLRELAEGRGLAKENEQDIGDVPRNYRALERFRDRVRQLWHRALNRRSQRGRINEAAMNRIATCWLPKPRICHPYPERRLP